MAFDSNQVTELHAQLRTYLGAIVCSALEDEAVTDIKVGPDGLVWLTKHGEGDVCTGGFLPESQRFAALNTMASLLGKHINAEVSRLSGELPLTGDRIQGFVPPTSPPAIYIRCHAPEVFTFANYIEKGILLPWQVEVIRKHVQKRSAIGFSGSTGSGKTTLLNTTLMELVDSNEHVVVLQDTKEIKCKAPNFSELQTSEEVSLQQLVMDSMRMKPDRIIIGEVRDAAGLEVLKALQTGHKGGMFTVHSDSAMGVFERFAQFCQEAGVPPQWRLMQSTIGLIVHMEMTPKGRRVTEIKEVVNENTVDQIPIRLKELRPQQAVALTH